MLNKIFIMGRLTRDPELRRTQTGTPVASFSLAVVEGRLQIRDWTDRDGNKRRSAEVVADQVYFGDSKRDGDGGGYSAGYSQQSAPAPMGGGYASAPAAPSGYGAPPANGDQFAELSDDDGELPF